MNEPGRGGRPPRAAHRGRGPVLAAHSHSASSSSRPAPRESGHPPVQRVAVEEGRSTSRGARRAGCSSDWLEAGMRKHHLHIGWPSLACHWLPTQCRPDYLAVVRSLESSQFDWHSPLLGPSLAVGCPPPPLPLFSLLSTTKSRKHRELGSWGPEGPNEVRDIV